MRRPETGNLLAGLPPELPREIIELLAGSGDIRIERIISRGHASPAGFWYDQEKNEFVLVLQGGAGLEFFEGDGPVVMAPGDWLVIPAHVRHRVAWTVPDLDTVWLAVFYR